MPSPRTTQLLEARVADIRKGLATVELVLPNLPPDLRSRYGRLADRMRDAHTNVEQLQDEDRTADAAELAAETWLLFRTENPLRAIVEDAVETFGPLVTSILAPLDLVENIARLTVHLGGRSYDLWKARALRMPFSPAVKSLVLEDAAIGTALLTETRAFSEAFADELAADDQTFARTVAVRYVREGDVDWLWNEYADRFGAEVDFRAGAETFRSAAEDVIMARIDAELRDIVESAAVETSVGYDTLAVAIDRIRGDLDGAARLDALLTVFEALHRGGGRLPSMLDKVKKELVADTSS